MSDSCCWEPPPSDPQPLLGSRKIYTLWWTAHSSLNKKARLGSAVEIIHCTFFAVGKTVLQVEWGVGKYFPTVGTDEALRMEVGAHCFQAVLNNVFQWLLVTRWADWDLAVRISGLKCSKSDVDILHIFLTDLIGKFADKLLLWSCRLEQLWRC